MVRSQILKDLVNGEESLENILLRLKVILTDLESNSIMTWVNSELEGYQGEVDMMPKYRVLKGTPRGTFLVNYVHKYTHSSIPLRMLVQDEELYDKIITLYMTDSISAIQNILTSEQKDNYVKVIDTGFCHAISREELQIANMSIKYGSNQLDGIISKIKSKVVDVVIELESRFDNLDELDIGKQIEKDSSKRDKAVFNIQNILYDSSVKMGDQNKVVKSKLGQFFGND